MFQTIKTICISTLAVGVVCSNGAAAELLPPETQGDGVTQAQVSSETVEDASEELPSVFINLMKAGYYSPPPGEVTDSEDIAAILEIVRSLTLMEEEVVVIGGTLIQVELRYPSHTDTYSFMSYYAGLDNCELDGLWYYAGKGATDVLSAMVDKYPPGEPLEPGPDEELLSVSVNKWGGNASTEPTQVTNSEDLARITAIIGGLRKSDEAVVVREGILIQVHLHYPSVTITYSFTGRVAAREYHWPGEYWYYTEAGTYQELQGIISRSKLQQ